MGTAVWPFLFRAAIFAAVVAGAAPSAAQVQFETIHEFVQGPGAVYGRLVQAADGHLYGVARDGGAYGGGTVFVIRRSGGEWLPAATLHDFRSSEGTHPIGGLVQGSPGVLYGTTSEGGAFGGGTIFRVTVFGTFQMLAALNPAVHGQQPIAELTRGLDLNFYGTTLAGGAGQYGTVFRMTPSGSLTVLRAFSGPDGRFPAGALAIGIDGSLYGTTWGGGANERGTVFRLTHAGAFTHLHSFTVPDIHRPLGRLTLAPDGALYGAGTGPLTSLPPPLDDLPPQRGGLFRVAPNGTVTTFRGFVGSGPGPGVTVGPDGWLYGSRDGGPGVYRVQPGTGTFEFVVTSSDDFPTGEGGYGTFIFADDGRFYRGTGAGGIGSYGTVFSVTPAGDLRILHSFHSGGFHPTSSLLPRDDGVLAGSTYSGGRDSVGTVFALHPGLVVETRADLPPGHGNFLGDLVPFGFGVMAPTTARIMILVKEGLVERLLTMLWQHTPVGSPVEASDGNVYAANTLDRIVRTGDGAMLHEFTGPDGRMPNGLMHWEGVLYGVTRYGGAYDRGTIFSLALDGTFTTLHHFSGPDGQWPLATLSLSNDLGLTGTTIAGGDTSSSPDGNGTVFKINRDGSGFTMLHAFGPGEGSQPLGRLMWLGDGTLYGTTFSGGLGFGTVFSVSLDGTFQTVHAFAPGEGAFPFGGVTFGFDGRLYGTTVFGGRGNVGTIFRISGVQ